MNDDLPSVGTEPERLALNAALGYVERNTPQLVRDEIRSLAAERDELASRVADLEVGATRWRQLEHMYSKGATADTLGHYIGRPERLDYAAQLRSEHDAAISAKKVGA